jgi:hypothetical protein
MQYVCISKTAQLLAQHGVQLVASASCPRFLQRIYKHFLLFLTLLVYTQSRPCSKLFSFQLNQKDAHSNNARWDQNLYDLAFEKIHTVFTVQIVQNATMSNSTFQNS